MKKSNFYIKLLTFTMLGVATIFSSCKEEDVNLTSITLSKVESTIELNGTEQLTVVYTPNDATFKELEWKSDDESIATVADGLVTANAIGSTIITATSTVDNAIKATCEITVIPYAGQVFTVAGDITENVTWFANAKYKLNGFVYVKNNAILTIEPGTVITGVIDSKGTLIVEAGSKIMAQGTTAKPIVFTSDKPVGQRAAGDWGGLVICGKAKTNKADGGVGLGIAEGGIGSTYGGTDDSDNSGILQYVRIEFPGIALSATANSEINGLTLYSVGSGTTIDHIQVSFSGDDSYEWFGGTVNCKYLVATRTLDDLFDTDNGFKGTIQFAVGISDAAVADQSKSNGFESDNDAGGTVTEPFTSPIFSNVTLYGPASTSADAANSLFQSAMHLRRNTRTSIYNSLFIGWPSGLFIDGEKGSSPTNAETDLLQIENSILAGMTANYKVSSAATQNDAMTIEELTAYYTDAARHNSINTLADILGASKLSLTNPAFVPVASSLLTGASFSNSRLSDNAFIDKTGTFVGAFGSTDWTAGWCNFDPQNTTY